MAAISGANLMARLPSRESLISDLQREKHNHHATYMVLQALMYRREVVTHVVGREGYSAKVVDPWSPTGGWVAITWASQGQRPSVVCYHYEDWIDSVEQARRYIGKADAVEQAFYEMADKIRQVVRERRMGHCHTSTVGL